MPFTTTTDSISVCDLLTKWLNDIKKKPLRENRWLSKQTKKRTKDKVSAKKASPDVGENKVSESIGAERDTKGSTYPKSAVLGKRGPKSACRVEYPLVKKSVLRCDLGEETIERLKMKIDFLESENMLKEMMGTPFLSVKERDAARRVIQSQQQAVLATRRVIMMILLLIWSQLRHRRTSIYL